MTDAPGAAAPAGALAMDPANPAQVPGSESAPPPEQQTPPAGTNGQAADVDTTSDDDDIQLPDGSVVPRAIAESVRDRYAKERIKRREYEKTLEEWGGMDAVREAVDLQKHMQTEDGVVDLFIETARALGIGVDKLESLFQQGQQAEGEGEDGDQLLTLREARELLAREVQPRFQQQEMEVATNRAKATVAEVLGQLGVEDPDDMTTILQLGDRYLPEGTLDPDKVANAVRRGHADWLNIVEKRSQEYLKKKAEQGASVPKTPAGGAAPASSPPEPPHSVDEAKQRVRERLRAMSG